MSERRAEYPADGFCAAAGSSLHLLRRQPDDGAGPAFADVLVTHGAAVNAARWNRNNKVVASGCADGRIQLMYGSGQVMCVLPRDGAAPAPHGAVCALAWSAGSKRLAAGSSAGAVSLHDMQQKHDTLVLGGHVGGVTAVEYQHDDAFLAVASAGGSVVLYPDPHRPGGSAAAPLAPTADAAPRLCLAVGAAEALVAAGSAAGGLAVWDVPTQRLRQEYTGQHGGGAVNAVAALPLRPGWLYSAGTDGRVCLQDLRSGPGAASEFSVGAPATALMVKEDHLLLGVGSADGVVTLYDPRQPQQALHTLRLPERQPVTALHWQHRFPSLASRHRAAAAATAAAASGDAGQPRVPSRLSSQFSASADGAVAASATAAGAGAGAAASLGLGQPASSSRAVPAAAMPIPAPVAAPRPATAAPTTSSPATPLASSLQVPAAQPAPAPPGVPQPNPMLPLAVQPSSLAVTPLPGMAAWQGGAATAPGEVTPRQQQQQQQQQVAALSQAAEQMQQLAVTPLGGGPGRQPQASLAQLAAAAPPAELAVTPLVAPPPQRPQASAMARPPRLDVSRLADLAAGGGASLAISPLPGMQPPTGPSPAASPHGYTQQPRSVLGERNNSRGGHSMLPALASPLPAGTEAPLRASPSFEENVPLLSPGSPARPAFGKPATTARQHAAAPVAPASGPADAKQKAAGGPALAQLSPAGSGSLPQWSIGAGRMAGDPSAAQHDVSPAAAAALQQATEREFSFAAAERSLAQLSSGAGLAAPWSSGGGEGGGSGGPAAPGALRDDILALHFDMLTQFQAQQASMGQLVTQLLERNESLGGEVAALRRQLSTLATRRDAFLWL